MIEEDLEASNQIKLELIYQREELEQYSDKTKSENNDLNIICFDSLNLPYGQGTTEEQWHNVFESLVSNKQRNLLLDLIRELH